MLKIDTTQIQKVAVYLDGAVLELCDFKWY